MAWVLTKDINVERFGRCSRTRPHIPCVSADQQEWQLLANCTCALGESRIKAEF